MRVFHLSLCLSQESRFQLEATQEIPKEFSHMLLPHSITCYLEVYLCQEIFPLEPCTLHCSSPYRENEYTSQYLLHNVFFLLICTKFVFLPYLFFFIPHLWSLQSIAFTTNNLFSHLFLGFPQDISFSYHGIRSDYPFSQYLLKFTQLDHFYHLFH